MNTKRVLIAFFLLLIMNLSYAERVMMDHRGGNGGLGLASKYTIIAKNIIKAWEDICNKKAVDEEAFCIHLRDFQAMVNKDSDLFITVLSRKDVTAHDGEPRDASNNGVDQILVNSSIHSLWRQPNSNPDIIKMKINNVMHEYASLVRLDSSDNYDFSLELFSLFIRKRYNLKKIASDYLLPDSCSLSIVQPMTSIGKSAYNDIHSLLTDKNYKVRPSIQSNRYKLKVYNTCSTEMISNTCGLFIQQIDTLRNLVVKTKFVVDNQNFTSDKSIVSSMLDELKNDFSNCE